MNPNTVEEWAEYIKTLDGPQLWSKSIAANSIEFVRILQEELFSPEEITEIFLLFALQFVEVDMAPPEMPDQYLSYADLLDSIGR
jgi:hypothetical protein